MKKIMRYAIVLSLLLTNVTGSVLCMKQSTTRKRKKKKTTCRCQYCNRGFTAKKDMRRHIRTACKKSPQAATRTGYPCPHCSKRFSEKGNRDKHARNHCEFSPEAATRKKYPCPHCSKRFSVKGSRDRHARTACKLSPEAATRTGYPCPHCKQPFSTKGNRDTHAREICPMRATAIAAAVATSEATPSVLGKRIRVKEEPLEDEPPRKRRKLRDTSESDFDGIEIKVEPEEPGYDFYIPEQVDL